MAKLEIGKNDLETINPRIASEWDYEKNGNLKPSDILPNSHYKVWWLCPKGHSYACVVSQRNKGIGCPYCSGRYPIKGENDLATLNPELSKEWDYEKNGNLKPSDVMPYSEKKVWWRYKCGHRWIASVHNRSSGQGCPICAGKVVVAGINDLETINPVVAGEWHPTKNITLKPSQVTPNSHKKVWWVCPNGHEYEDNLFHRNMGRGCPYCSSHKVSVGENDLATLNPELSKEWDYEKNGNLKPSDVMPNSEKKVWWLCPKGHSYKTDIGHRSQGRGCPICDRENKTSFPEQAIAFYLKKVFKVSSRIKLFGKEVDIYIDELKTGIEYDGIAFHSWDKAAERELSKNKVMRQNGIRLIRVKETDNDFSIQGDVIQYKFDKGQYKQLNLVIESIFALLNIDISIEIDINQDGPLIYSQYLETEKDNSFVKINTSLLNEWDYDKNGTLNPNYISHGSSKKVWWKCNLGHSYLMSPYDRLRGRGCSICKRKK